MRMCLSKKRKMFETGEDEKYHKPNASGAEFGQLEGEQKSVSLKCMNLVPGISVVQGCICMFIVEGVMFSLTNIDLLEVREIHQPWLQSSGFEKDFLYLTTAILAALLSPVIGCGIVFLVGILLAAFGLFYAGYILENDEEQSVVPGPLLGLGMSFAFVSSVLTVRSSGQVVAAGLGRIFARVVFPDLVAKLVQELGWSSAYYVLGGITITCLLYGFTIYMQDTENHMIAAMKIVENVEKQNKCEIVRNLGKMLILSMSHSLAFTGINILLVKHYYSMEEEKQFLAMAFVLGGLGGLIFAATGCRKFWFNPLILGFDSLIFAVPLAFLYAVPQFPFLSILLFVYFGFFFAFYIGLHVPVIQTILGPELAPLGFGIIFTSSGLFQKVLIFIATQSEIFSSNPVLMFWFSGLFYSVALLMNEKKLDKAEELEPISGRKNNYGALS